MEKKRIRDSFGQNPIIAAVRNEEHLDAALLSPVSNIFVLNADILNVGRLINKIKNSGKNAILHIDLLEGLGRDNKAVDFIINNIQPDGIITTRTAQIKHLSDKTFVIQRIFMIDNQSFETGIRTADSLKPDMIELMPGIIPRVISEFAKHTSVPIIAGGMVSTKDDVISALNAGAVAVSTGRSELWTV
ncbi:MAG: glycerol-3-phosphate responsive antiterminator [Bacillota bacterium]|nr:glycerol-3-phosphate responsive antiterminator [Bacillota bacterium]